MDNPLFPALFIGHGSPMNALAANSYTRDLQKLGSDLPEPEAIVVISAHWQTRGTMITGAVQPEQIYDFYGFPPELYKIIYRAPGALEIAKLIAESVGDGIIKVHDSRGIDHAAWAVLKHMYPLQVIPVLELSLDVDRDWKEHLELAKKLLPLRSKNILIMGSGNIVHNLSDFAWEEDAPHFPWAVEFDELVKNALLKKDIGLLLDYKKLGPLAHRAVPTDEHYLPMLYVLGLMQEHEKPVFVHESIQNGSISMRSFICS
jgi:4,5-DOPA dioxygenase extradiol